MEARQATSDVPFRNEWNNHDVPVVDVREADTGSGLLTTMTIGSVRRSSGRAVVGAFCGAFQNCFVANTPFSTVPEPSSLSLIGPA